MVRRVWPCTSASAVGCTVKKQQSRSPAPRSPGRINIRTLTPTFLPSRRSTWPYPATSTRAAQRSTLAMAKSPHGKAKWPQLCQYFGLVGGPPGERSLDFQAFGREHAETWKKLEKEHG